MKYNYCPLCATELTHMEVEGEMRDACPSETCSFVHYNNPTPVVAGIIEYEGNIILARNTGWPEGMFGLITGFLEADESPEEGMARELKEELALDTINMSFIGNYPFHQRNELLIAFHVEAEGLILRNEEIAEIKKVHPDELEPWRFGTGFAVRDWLANR